MVRQFFKDSFIYSFSNILTVGFGVIMMPFYTKNLTPAEYGVIDIVNILNAFITVILGLELTQAIPKYYSDLKSDIDSQNTFISSCLLFNTLGGLFLLILVIIFSENLSILIFQDSKYSLLLVIAATSYIFSRIFQVIIIVLRNDGKAIQVSSLAILSSLITLTTTIILVLKFKMGVYGIFIANLCSQGLIGLYLIYKYFYYFHLSFNSFWFRKALLFSIPLLFSAMSGVVLNYTDRILINNHLGLSEVGIFGVAYRISSVTNLILFGFTTAIVPLVYSSYQNQETPKKIEAIFRYFLAISFSLMLFISVFAEDIVLLFTTNEYLKAAYLLPFLLIVNLLNAVGYFFPGMFLMGKTKIVAIITVSSAILNIFLNLLLLPKFGLIGSAIATLISILLSSIATMIFSQSLYKIPYRIKSFVFITAYFLFFLFFPYINLTNILGALNLIIVKILVISSFIGVIFLSDFVSFREVVSKVKLIVKKRESDHI